MPKKKKVYKHSEELRAEVVGAVKVGHSVGNVAKQHGLAPSAVYSWLKAAGVPNPGRKGAKAEPKVSVRLGMTTFTQKPPKAQADTLTIKIAASYLANAIKHWDSERAKPLVQLAFIELKEAL